MLIKMIGLQPEWTWCGAHSHAVWELVIYRKGTGTHTIGNEKIRFHPGLIVCQPPDVLHSVVADTNYQDLYITVTEFIPPDALIFDDVENRLYNMALIAHSIYHKREANYENIMRGLSNAMYQMLIGLAAEKKSASRNSKRYIDEFISKLIQNFQDPSYKSATAVSETGYCPDHFRRQFKDETGYTPNEYLIQIRIDNARKLMDQKFAYGISIKEIARLSGFTDQYYFSRLFKEKIGLSPSDYMAERAL